jgi:hypothetical protein
MQTSIETKTFTFKDRKDEMITSEYGVISYSDWCKKEVERLRKAGSFRSYYESNGYCWIN